MKYGLILPIQAIDMPIGVLWDELIAEAAAAEAAGFDAVFLPEFHQARGGALCSPLPLGAALLQATSTLRFGTAVLATPLHHPVRLAEDALMLDWLSKGRFVLGLGIGHQAPDFALYGAPRGERAAVFDEQLDIVRAAFGSSPFEHRGVHYSLAGHVTPAPHTPGGPPIWIGAHSRAGIARAARHAERWLVDPQRDVTTAARLGGVYRNECDAAGRAPRVGLFREAFIGDSAAQVSRDWGPHALAVHRLYYNVGVYRKVFEPWVDDVRDRADFTFERLAPGRFLYGSGDDIRRTVDEWQAVTGCDYLALRMRQPGGPPHNACLEAIARFGSEVINR